MAFGLDYILDQVNFLMKSLGTPHALAVDELYLIMKLAQGQYLRVVTLALLLYGRKSPVSFLISIVAQVIII